MMRGIGLGFVLGLIACVALPAASSGETMPVCLILSDGQDAQWSYVFNLDDVSSSADTNGNGNAYRLYSLHGVRVLRNGFEVPNQKGLSPVSGTALLNWNDSEGLFIDTKFTITESDDSSSVIANEAAVTRVRIPILEADAGGAVVTDDPQWTRVEVSTGATTQVMGQGSAVTVVGDAVNTKPDCMRPANPN